MLIKDIEEWKKKRAKVLHCTNKGVTTDMHSVKINTMLVGSSSIQNSEKEGAVGRLMSMTISFDSSSTWANINSGSDTY